MKDVYLVTGGCGFIGSHIVDALKLDGKQVRIVDIVNGDDIRNDTDGWMSGVDYVIHQAAIPGVKQSVDAPLATNSVNIEGTLSLLVEAAKRGVKRFVYASSSSVYGNATPNPKDESMRPCPESPYAVSKYAGELYCNVYNRLYGLPTVILRYFNVFGPRHQANVESSAVIPCFFDSVLGNASVTIEGDGEQSRDFTYIQNVVEANLLACERPQAIGETFNIGCGESTSINDLSDLVCDVTGASMVKTHRQARDGDVKHSCASIEKARTMLGYEPKVSLGDGLERTWKWLNGQRS